MEGIWGGGIRKDFELHTKAASHMGTFIKLICVFFFPFLLLRDVITLPLVRPNVVLMAAAEFTSNNYPSLKLQSNSFLVLSTTTG